MAIGPDIIPKMDSLDAALLSFYAAPHWEGAQELVEEIVVNAPVHRTSMGFTIVAGHADANELSRSGRAVRELPAGAGSDSGMRRVTQHFLSLSNPPDHRRLRSLAQQAFAPKAMRALAPQMHRAADDFVAAALRDQVCDWMQAVARPLPAEMFMAVFELSPAQRDRIVPLIGHILDGIATNPTDAQLESAKWAAEQFVEAVLEIIGFRRRHPGSDLLTALIEASDAGDRLTVEELLSMTCQLFVAGMETTSGLIGGGVLELLRSPDQWRRLVRDESLVHTAVDECLRVAGPVAALPMRVVEREIDLPHGRLVEGERVTIWLAAANRDPAVFVDPWRLDVGRFPNPHLAFSTGIHFCLGANLARLEATAVLEAIIRRGPGLRLADGIVEFDSSSIMHRPHHYLVTAS